MITVPSPERHVIEEKRSGQEALLPMMPERWDLSDQLPAP